MAFRTLAEWCNAHPRPARSQLAECTDDDLTALADDGRRVLDLDSADYLAAVDGGEDDLVERLNVLADVRDGRRALERVTLTRDYREAAYARPDPETVATTRASRIPPHRQPPHAPGRVSQTRMLRGDGVPYRDDAEFLDAFAMSMDTASRGMRRGADIVARVLPDPADDLPRLTARDSERNAAVIASARLAAVTASGGLCTPTPWRYDLPVLASSVRPVRAALVRLDAPRGGIRYTIGPSLADVAAGVGVWTNANDRNPTSPTTKPVLTLPCDDDETEVLVDAFTQALKVGNFAARWNPERVQAFLATLDAAHARLAETTLLTRIIADSVAVTSATVLGATRDLFETWGRLASQARSRERAATDATVTVIAPSWARDLMAADLLRQMPGDDTVGRADALLNAAARDRNLRLTYSPDLDPFTTAQSAGAVTSWPATVRSLLFLAGTWAHLDAGTLDLGTEYRSPDLIKTNDAIAFSETFENVARIARGESFVLTSTVTPDGSTRAAK